MSLDLEQTSMYEINSIILQNMWVYVNAHWNLEELHT